MTKAATLWLGLFLAFGAQADSLDSLAQFLKQTRSMRADFVQVVAAPAKEGRPSKPKTSSGSFAFVRPSVFRFDYNKPFVQNIVADGKNLWLFDADLNQVTVRNQAQALGSTPASLIASASDLATLGKEFELLAAPSEAGVDWVVAKPKVKDSSLQQVRIGLRSEDGQMVLAHLDIVDAFGTRSQMRFDKVDVNPSQLTASQFNFVPPKGADVVRP
ncbi:MAG: outer membrane lipoprotein chaperone LolA [Limnohabitans sp.]|jgi:outer membrane lipoprotein carrier protein|nr:outer membrane lipoprotein chaperone LolA [Limnohabitans sp.]